MNPGRFSGKRIAVFGLHSSGVAVAQLLDDLGAEVRVTDPKTANQLRCDVGVLKGRAIEFLLGEHDHRCIENVDLIVLSPGVPLNIPILKEARSLCLPIVGELEIAASVCPAPIVAITGTKGKSTTTLLTAEILKQSEKIRKVCVSGNIGVPLSSEVQTLTKEDLVVLEASSFQLETTTMFRPVVSVVLNLTRDHLDRHETMEAYRNAKLKVCANQTSADWIVLNADDPVVARFSEATDANAVYFSDNPKQAGAERYIGAGIRAGKTSVEERGTTIFARWDGQSRWICDVSEISLVGRHNVCNVLAATAVAQIIGMSCKQIRRAIRGFCPKEHLALEHVLEPVKTVNGIQFVNDSKATNVDAVKAAIESTSNPLLLIMGGYDKGNDYSLLINLVKSKVKGLILLGTYTQIIRNVLSPHVVTWDATTMGEAVRTAYSHAVPGDVVLLSPANASFDMFDDYKSRGCAFREAVNQLEAMDEVD